MKTHSSITLPPQLEDRIIQKVLSGAYRSPDEVLIESLRLLDERDHKLAALRSDIQIGIDQADRGEVTQLDMKALIGKLRAKHEKQTPIQ